MKTEYICIITMNESDVRLSAANGGLVIEHPIPPVKTIIRLSNEAKERLTPE